MIILIFTTIWHYFWGLIGISLNVILIYVAVFKSPKAIHVYATLIVNFGLTDFMECLSGFITEIRVLPASNSPGMIYISYGLCKYFEDLVCELGVSVFLHCVTHSTWSLLLSFGYRYYVLHNHTISRKSLIPIILLIYIPSLFQASIYWTNFVGRDVILPLSTTWFPQYNLSLEHGAIFGIIDVTTWSAAYCLAHVCFPIFPIYIAIFLLRRKIIRHLAPNNALMSNDTRALHTQLLMVLTVQAIIPLFNGVGVISFLIIRNGFVVSLFLECCVFACTILSPAISPITYLFFVRPYRQWILRKTHIRNKLGEVTPIYQVSASAEPSNYAMKNQYRQRI